MFKTPLKLVTNFVQGALDQNMSAKVWKRDMKWGDTPGTALYYCKNAALLFSTFFGQEFSSLEK